MKSVVDLTSCDREPIHIPGSIQPHGYLMVLEEPELKAIQVSSNCWELLDRPTDKILGQRLADLVTIQYLHAFKQLLPGERINGNPQYLAPMRFSHSDRLLEGSIHRHDGALLLQLEPHLPDHSVHTLDAFLQARSVLNDSQRARSLDEFSDLAAAAVRENTGYDRVMVYRFLEDGSGEVIGESKRADLGSWMGLRYPSSDIPKQARALYLKSWLRIIADVNATPAAMTPALNPMTGNPLDMSFCVLRSVSPIHLQYMRNLGGQASMSLSLIHENRLWGLITCYHQAPRKLSHQERIACEFLAHSFSLQIGLKHDSRQREYAEKLRASVDRLKEQLSADVLLEDALLNPRWNIATLFRASGAAVVTRSETHLRGVTPGQADIAPLLEWLRAQPQESGVYYSDALSAVFPRAASYAQQASGMLALQLEGHALSSVLWFRQEVSQVVNWAGNPNKPVVVDEQGLTHLSPRNSFALWREEAQGKSEPWHEEERRAAKELRQALMESMLRKADATSRANVDLARSNSELEAFATAAGHDLKGPLRGIRFHTEMLQESAGARMNPEELAQLNSTLELTRRMGDLIDSLLEFSRVGQLELHLQQVDGDELLTGVLTMLKPQLLSSRVLRPKPLGYILADPVRLRELFHNLISNASKYNDKVDKWIEVGLKEGEPRVFYVRDNGIGIDPEQHKSIFRIFNRLHGPEEFGGGAGAGLTIAQRIVERHGGSIWLNSTPGLGSTFFFTLES